MEQLGKIHSAMRKPHRSVAHALALMLALPAAEALDIHGIHLGDRWDAAKLEQELSYPTVPVPQRVQCTDHGDETCAGTTRYFFTNVRLIIEGQGGRVRKITMTLPTDDFENVITALKHQFGQPTDEWSSQSSASTPLLFHHRVDWRLPNEELFALKFSTMATIRLTTPEESVAGQYPAPN